MFPYRDDNPTNLTPVVTIGLIIVAGVAWLLVQGAGSPLKVAESVCELGLIPGELLRLVPPGTEIAMGHGVGCRLGVQDTWLTVLTSMFLHGSWLHLIGNMLFLWVFGNNIEDAMGHGRFLAFYLICGILAAAAQVGIRPSSVVPMVGASGAISGVMGAYLVLYPRARVHLLVFLGFFVTTIRVPAYLMLLYWAFLQLVGTMPLVGGSGQEGGVAFAAHLGGFVVGVALIKVFARDQFARLRRRPRLEFREFGGDQWY